MKDFVKRKRVLLMARGGPIHVEYRERRDGRRGQLTVNGLVMEIGPTIKIKRRYHQFIAQQTQQLGQGESGASLNA